MKFQKNIPGLFIGCLLVSISTVHTASAATVSYDMLFTEGVTSTTPGATYTGSFSFDDSFLSSSFIAFDDFISFDITIDGSSYSLADATNGANDGINVVAGSVTYFGDQGPGTAANFNPTGVPQLNLSDIPSMAWNQIGGADGTYSISSVPVPAAAWLFGSGLLGLVGIARRKASV